jgi:type I restriction enzyme R subunit
VNRTAKYKNDCKIVDFSYNNVNVQNIKAAFEHFSDVVVSDFDPFSDQKILALLLPLLKKSDIFEQFFSVFMSIYQDKTLCDDPVSYLDFESSLKAYIDANPKSTADIKAKAAQYFSILNRIEYVIELDAKYRESSFLFFWRKFNTLYNLMHRSVGGKDPIEVYFDNQIGIVEVNPFEPIHYPKPPLGVAEGKPGGGGGQFDILKIIAARNEQEAKTGTLIEEFEAKILNFFQYVRNDRDGERLVVKIKSDAPEGEIYEDFGRIYRRYRAVNRPIVGDYFFKETEDLIDKLCDDFEITVRGAYA